MQSTPTLTGALSDYVTAVAWLIPVGLVAVFILILALMALTARSPRRHH